MQTRSESLKVTRFEGQTHSIKHEGAQPWFMQKELEWAESDLRNSKKLENAAGMVANRRESGNVEPQAVKCVNTKGWNLERGGSWIWRLYSTYNNGGCTKFCGWWRRR